MKYTITILPNGSQCLSANTGRIETLDMDSNVIEFNYNEEIVGSVDNKNHVDDYFKHNNTLDDHSNTPYLRHCPVSYENNLDKLCNIVHIVAH